MPKPKDKPVNEKKVQKIVEDKTFGLKVSRRRPPARGRSRL